MQSRVGAEMGVWTDGGELMDRVLGRVRFEANPVQTRSNPGANPVRSGNGPGLDGV